MTGYTGPPIYGSEPRGSDPYGSGPHDGNPYGGGPANGRAPTDGHIPSVRGRSSRTPADTHEEVRRLIEARDPEAALYTAARYLQEGHQIRAQAAHQFSEAQRMAVDAESDLAEAAAERRRLARLAHELEREQHDIEVRTRVLDMASEGLAAREAAIEAFECEIQEMTRRQQVTQAAPPPDPSVARNLVELVGILADFHQWGGNRSLRHIAVASGSRISASTAGNILRGSTLPQRLEVIEAFVIGCGGDNEAVEAFRCAWRRLRLPPPDSTLTDIPPIRREIR